MYKRQVIYLDTYENGEILGNCGYAKIHINDEECRIEVNADNVFGKGKNVTVYLFWDGDNGYEVKEVFSEKMDSGEIHLKDIFRCEDIWGNGRIEHIEGIFMFDGGNFMRAICGTPDRDRVSFGEVGKKIKQAEESNKIDKSVKELAANNRGAEEKEERKNIAADRQETEGDVIVKQEEEKNNYTMKDAREENNHAAENAGEENNHAAENAGEENNHAAENAGEENNYVVENAGEENNHAVEDVGEENNHAAGDAEKENDFTMKEKKRETSVIIEKNVDKSSEETENVDKKIINDEISTQSLTFPQGKVEKIDISDNSVYEYDEECLKNKCVEKAGETENNIEKNNITVNSEVLHSNVLNGGFINQNDQSPNNITANNITPNRVNLNNIKQNNVNLNNVNPNGLSANNINSYNIGRRRIYQGRVNQQTEKKSTEQDAENSENMTMTWQEKLFRVFPKVILKINGQNTCGIKLKPHDMVWFPGCYWRLGSNKFLLNGYYHYRYILFFRGTGNYEGKFFLGTPGCFGVNDAIAARKYGFTDFFAAGECPKEEQTFEEKEQINFGFWGREL